MDYFQANKEVKENIKAAKAFIATNDYLSATMKLNELLNYELVDMDLVRDCYELLAKILVDTEGKYGIDALPLLMNGNLYEDPLIDMNVNIGLNAMEQQAIPGSALLNSRDEVLKWLINNTSEFARVNIEELSRDLGIDKILIRRIIEDAMFDGYIVGKFNTDNEFMILPYEQEKRQLKCIICYQMIDFDDPTLVRCKFCGSAAHEEEILKWAEVSKNKCPRCMSELELIRGI
ncbi:MAG: hypothetical protein ACTSVY_09590 [Candidatus Helarchaeota archaeon]